MLSLQSNISEMRRAFRDELNPSSFGFFAPSNTTEASVVSQEIEDKLLQVFYSIDMY
jgi:hypothetical protein